MEKRMFKTVCSNCEEDTEVPFKPDGKRPVYCRTCLQKHRVKENYKNDRRNGGRNVRREEEDEDYDEEYD